MSGARTSSGIYREQSTRFAPYLNTMLNFKERAQWPHTIDDIRGALDGVWGVVGATNLKSGNLFRLERSLKEPTSYTLIQYEGEDESKIVSKQTFESKDKETAIDSFARAIGFEDGSFVELS